MSCFRSLGVVAKLLALKTMGHWLDPGLDTKYVVPNMVGPMTIVVFRPEYRTKTGPPTYHAFKESDQGVCLGEAFLVHHGGVFT